MQEAILRWYDAVARDLPWRRTKDPYSIWLSEIMLQQTRVETVIGYYHRFLGRFPTPQALAAADEQDVLKAWEGLGYYSRARNLHKCAKEVVSCHSGTFPQDPALLKKLPGIGDYTAGAVASIAFGIHTPAIDGNVERVISRLCGIREDVSIPAVKRRIHTEAEALVPKERPGDFNQAMMELGARVCLPGPRCVDCPISRFCNAYSAGDADTLPIKRRKAQQKMLHRGIAIVFHEHRVLLHKREERLLQGLWCFPGFDHAKTQQEIQGQLASLGIQARHTASAGEARHVFTHIIWEMTLHHFEAIDKTCPEGWLWADAHLLSSLPFPTAMKSARAYAESILDEA